MILTGPQLSRPDGLCVNCERELATEDWCPGGALAYTHGMRYRWCRRCVLTEQIRHCREAAERLSRLEAELSGLAVPRA